MSSSATGVGMTICFLGAILLILTQKSSQKFGDVLGIMVLDLRLTRLGLSGAPFFYVHMSHLNHTFNTNIYAADTNISILRIQIN